MFALENLNIDGRVVHGIQARLTSLAEDQFLLKDKGIVDTEAVKQAAISKFVALTTKRLQDQYNAGASMFKNEVDTNTKAYNRALEAKDQPKVDQLTFIREAVSHQVEKAWEEIEGDINRRIERLNSQRSGDQQLAIDSDNTRRIETDIVEQAEAVLS